jgi:hypothetical protein
MDLVKYAKTARVLIFIPLFVGVLMLSELILPSKEISTQVIDKNESYRAKFNHTTYNIYFESNNDQFTESIFNALEVGDKVKLHTTYFTKEVNAITKVATNATFENETNEVYVRIVMALIMLISFFYFFTKPMLTTKNIKIMLFVVFFTLINLFRIIKLNL